MSNEEKRIPVTEARLEELNELKAPGQTYEELLAEILTEYKKLNLFRDLNRIRAENEFSPL